MLSSKNGLEDVRLLLHVKGEPINDTDFVLELAGISSAASKVQDDPIFSQFWQLSDDIRTHRRLRERQEVQALTIRLRWSRGTLGRKRLDELFLDRLGMADVSYPGYGKEYLTVRAQGVEI